MDAGTIVILALVLFIIFLAFSAPVGLALAASGTIGLILLRDIDVASATLGSLTYRSIASFSLLVIPMFIFMGNLALHAGIPNQLFDAASKLLRRLPGGIGIATIAACAGFAAVTGSSVATAATLGRLSIGEMVKHGYQPRLAAGIVAAGGTLGVLIPPSIILVLYGIISGESIGALLIAGIIPGLLSAFLYIALIAIFALRGRASSGSVFGSNDETMPLLEREPVGLSKAHMSGIVRMSLLFMVVVGGIYSGLFTATESGALGAFLAFLFFLAHILRKTSRWEKFREALVDTSSLTSMVFLIVLGASIFSFFLVTAGVPGAVTRWALAVNLPATAVVIILLLLLIPLGMFLDSVSIVLIAMPLMYPVVTTLGFDGIWFGILVVKMIELGMITPPIGMNVFVVAGSSELVTVEDAFRGVAPFAGIDIFTIIVLFLFPWISTALPSAIA